MKLATIRNGQRDGALVVVSRDLQHAVAAQPVAATMMDALERWNDVEAALTALYQQLNAGRAAGAFRFDQRAAAAPLPRPNTWLDGSSFGAHGKLMKQSLRLERQPAAPFPLMLQGWANEILGPCDDEPLPSEDVDIDFEAEVGVVTSAVAARANIAQAQAAVRLLVLINDWTLRAHVPPEIASGFGFLRAKAPTAMAPVAVTPDELGAAWRDGRVHLPVQVEYNGRHWGHPIASGMDHSFFELVAHAATNRRLLPATIIGSGTISEGDPARVGSACIAEMRGHEIITQGAASSPYMRFGDRVRIEMPGGDGQSLFGVIEQRVVKCA